MELDGLFTFSGSKNEIDVVTQVYREIGCFMSWLAMTERSTDNMQEIVDEAPIAFQCYANGFSTDDVLKYHQVRYLVAPSKSQTYSV